MKVRRTAFRHQWGWPVGLAVLIVFGLLSALLGEGGIWWWLSWATLAAPLLVILYYVLHPVRDGRSRHVHRHTS